MKKIGSYVTSLVGELLVLNKPEHWSNESVMAKRLDHTFEVKSVWRQDGATLLTLHDIHVGDFLDDMKLDWFKVKTR